MMFFICAGIAVVIVILADLKITGNFSRAINWGMAGAYLLHAMYLQNRLVSELTKTLGKRLPICANCKKIRKGGGDPMKQEDWQAVENYISEKTDAQFSHSMCPECGKALYGDLWNEVEEERS